MTTWISSLTCLQSPTSLMSRLQSLTMRWRRQKRMKQVCVALFISNVSSITRFIMLHDSVTPPPSHMDVNDDADATPATPMKRRMADSKGEIC